MKTGMKTSIWTGFRTGLKTGPNTGTEPGLSWCRAIGFIWQVYTSQTGVFGSGLKSDFCTKVVYFFSGGGRPGAKRALYTKAVGSVPDLWGSLFDTFVHKKVFSGGHWGFLFGPRDRDSPRDFFFVGIGCSRRKQSGKGVIPPTPRNSFC